MNNINNNDNNRAAKRGNRPNSKSRNVDSHNGGGYNLEDCLDELILFVLCCQYQKRKYYFLQLSIPSLIDSPSYDTECRKFILNCPAEEHESFDRLFFQFEGSL